MNPDIGMKHCHGRMDDKHIRRHRNLRKVSPILDPEALDQLSALEAMRAKGAGWRSDFGKDSHAIAKFLEHRVGRKWDKVYSEVSHAFGSEGRALIEREVFIHTGFDSSGEIVVNDLPWCGMLLRQIHGSNLYVHPGDGVLRRAGRRLSRHVRYKRKPTAIVRGDLAYFVRNGLWYSTPVVTERNLIARLRRHGKGDNAQTLLHRIHLLPSLWTEATGEFPCDPDNTRQVSRRRVDQLKLAANSLAESGRGVRRVWPSLIAKRG